MALRLRDHLYWCRANGRLVFLDVKADRYFCLPFAAEAAFLRAGEGEERPGDRDCLRGLIARGMLIDEPGSFGPAPPVAPPPLDGDLPLPPGFKVPPAELVRALAAEACAALRLRGRSLRENLERAGRAPRRSSESGEVRPRLLRIVAASGRVATLAGAADRCSSWAFA